ncbi:alpha/beta hydrolase [Oleiagrimonas sp. C23AA]|uniref:esterase/lipase family protein n=1 Tax=Oleiagrimonas sp. C23AA TaxID=2719047 RepID=UPI001420AFD9|nr:alpha/beta hydrolase [Oleiagrimonas sp. C23AA]NII09966.1 alpha/beta fold hydrolase [Oleiagrimonas sp. C23AA]
MSRPPELPVPEHVILLHGLWMRRIVLAPLRARLREAGFAASSFDYQSTSQTSTEIMTRLRRHMQALAGTVHVVAHSLGGLLALQACRDEHGLPPGRLVCLGSPLCGSAGARGLSRWGASWLLGESRDMLEGGVAPWCGQREVGVIAGTTPIGLGALSEELGAQHDGSVAVAETRLEGITDHCVVEANHTGLLFSTEVAEQVVSFLHEGHFTAARAGGVRRPPAS